MTSHKYLIELAELLDTDDKELQLIYAQEVIDYGIRLKRDLNNNLNNYKVNK